MASQASHVPAGPSVVVNNPDEDCSPPAFRAFVDALLDMPEVGIEAIGAAEALGELRSDS